MDILEAEARSGQDGRRDDPRPRLCGPAFQQVAGGEPDGHRPRARRTSSSTRTSCRGRTAATSSSSAGTAVVLDDAHHHDDARGGERHFHDRGPEPLTGRSSSSRCATRSSSGPWSRRARRARLRRHRDVRGPARAGVHGRRHQPRAFPGVVAAYMLGARSTSVPRSPRSGRRSRIGWVTRRAGIRGDTTIGVLFAGTFALGVFLFSTIRGYVGGPVRLPVRRRPRDQRRGSRRAGVLASARPRGRRRALEGAAVRDVRPAGRGRVGPPRRPPRVPVPGAHRADDRDQPPGRRDHPRRGDARDARGDRPSWSTVRFRR